MGHPDIIMEPLRNLLFHHRNLKGLTSSAALNIFSFVLLTSRLQVQQQQQFSKALAIMALLSVVLVALLGSLSLSYAETGNLQFNRIQIPFILPPDREGSPAFGTAVCPSQNDAYDVDTGRCYPVGSGAVGPCGPLAEYQRNEKNPTYGECKCMKLPGCGRPLSYWPDHNRTCFELYTQGPCTADEWLVPARDVTSMCVPNLCYRYTPYYGNKDSSVLSFAFSHYGECFYTETQAFCRPNQVARFLDGQNAAICDDIANQNECMSKGASQSGYAAVISNDFNCPTGQVLAAGGECVNEDPLQK